MSMHEAVRAAVASLPRPAAAAPPPARVPEATRWVMHSGLRVVAIPRPGLPQVALRLVLPAGSAADPANGLGTAALVGALLTEGTRELSPERFNAELDQLGASLSVQVGHDFAEVDLFLLSETLREGVLLLGQMIREPAFPADQVRRVVAETLDALDARHDEPANVADDRLAEAVFGSGHPYGRLTAGTPEGVASATPAGLQRFHAAHYRPHGSVLVAAGDVQPDRLRALLEEALAGWSGRAEAPALPPPPATPPAAGRRIDVVRADAAQGELRLGSRGMQRTAAEWTAGAVANYVLGGSTITSRLGANLREDKGWTYGVRSGFAAGVQPGGWVVETAVDGAVVNDAMGEIEAELARFVAEGPDPDELQRAKDALILSLPRAFETPARVVGRIATVEAFGLDANYWEHFAAAVARVDAEAVRRVAARHFAPDALVRVVVGPG